MNHSIPSCVKGRIFVFSPYASRTWKDLEENLRFQKEQY